MRVLVTGGAGFIGSTLSVRLLERGDAVLALDNFNDYYDPEIKRQNVAAVRARDAAGRYFVCEADVRDAHGLMRAFEGFAPDAVVHLAACAGVRPSIEQPEFYYDVNVMGTLRLLEVMRRFDCRRMAYASSSSVYGNSEKAPFGEKDRVDKPISPYAASKKACELMLHVEHALHGLSVACLRFFTVYGPRQRPDLAISKFIRNMRAGQAIPVYGDGSTVRDYTYIDDIVDGALRALDWTAGAPRYDIFNLGAGRTISLNEMIKTIERVLGVEARIERLPMQMGDVDRTFADIAHAREVLGYRPATSFEAGIRGYVDWLNAR